MNNISKLGLIMCALSLLIVIILVSLLHQKIPNLVMYLFIGGLILNFIVVFRKIGENK